MRSFLDAIRRSPSPRTPADAARWTLPLSSRAAHETVGPAVAYAAATLAPPVPRAPDCSLRDFIRDAWHVPEPRRPFVPNWHLDAIAEHLEAVSRGEIQQLIINIPPRFAKSLVVAVFWPMWEWTWAPDRRWLFATYAQNLTIRDSIKCRRVIQSEWYQERWGDQFSLVADQNTKTKFENTRAGFRLATSTDGVGTGEGGDRIVVDDPHNVKKAESDAEREAAVEWWSGTMSTRMNDPETVAHVIVMQRLHERDLAGQMLEEGGYVHLCLPMRFEPQRRCVTVVGDRRWEDPRTEPGELLFPARFPEKAVAKLEAKLGSYRAAGQLQQRPTPAGGAIIKEHWWRTWTQLPPVTQQALFTWDMTFKGDETARHGRKGRRPDFVVGQYWIRLGAMYLFVDQLRLRCEFMEARQAVQALRRAWPLVRLTLIEDKANGPAIISSMRKLVPGLVAIDPGRSDIVARLRAVAPLVEAGNVLLPPEWWARQRYEYWRTIALEADAEAKRRGTGAGWLSPEYVTHDWVAQFRAEWEAVPKGANDDTVAAGVQAIERFVSGSAADDVEQHMREDERTAEPNETHQLVSQRF